MTEVITFRSDVKVELVDTMGDEARIVEAARVSTLGANSVAKKIPGLVKFLWRDKHTSPFEHLYMTFRIEMPLFVQNELVRHRMSSLNIESGRYKKFDPVFYVIPPSRPIVQVGKTGNYEFVVDDKVNYAERQAEIEWSKAWWGIYTKSLESGAAKEVARMTMPLNIYSTAYMTVNLHSALNIVRLRTMRYGSKPQYEISLLGEKIYDILKERYPTVIEQFDADYHVPKIVKWAQKLAEKFAFLKK